MVFCQGICYEWTSRKAMILRTIDVSHSREENQIDFPTNNREYLAIVLLIEKENH